jgi:ribosomal protein L11 methyltransferase
LKWVEVSLTVNGELAEAIADLLARYCTGGVALISTQIQSQEAEDYPIGPIQVCGFLPQDDQIERKRQQIDEGLWHLGQIMPIPQPAYRLLEEEDWAQAWKAHYRPIPVGERFVIVPAWSSIPEGDRIPLILDPGMAFGTGMHPSTRLCLIALENHLQPGHRVVDLGCGSGILSIAAARLGAGRVLGLDIDPLAVQTACENVKRNEVGLQVKLQVGSLENLLAAGTKTSQMAQLVLANILAPTLEKMIASGLTEAVTPGGTLILSGILDKQVEPLLATCEQRGFELVEMLSENDWRALVLRSTTTQLDLLMDL